MRLFFALWPDAVTQQHWFYSSGPLVNALGGNRTPAANLHLTLHFLGEVDGSRVSALTRLADAAVADSIDLRFDRIECWRKADLACLRPAAETAGLSRLVNQLADGLAHAGFVMEKRQFKAHVTLARSLRHPQAALPLWPALDWRADTLALVRSRLSATGPVYAPVAQWPLALPSAKG